MTHEKRLHDCAAKLYAFLSVMRRLGPKRVPLAFQSDASFRVGSLPLLAEFLTGLPSDLCYAVEVRHRGWLSDRFYRLLEDHHTPVVLADLVYMPKLDRVTTDFAYIQLLGKRSTIPDDFSRVRLDLEPELAQWAVGVRKYLERGLTVFVFANNHLQGHGPAAARTLPGDLAGVASRR